MPCLVNMRGWGLLFTHPKEHSRVFAGDMAFDLLYEIFYALPP